MIGEENLPEKGLLEKAATIKNFEYSPLGSELKKKVIATKQYQLLNKHNQDSDNKDNREEDNRNEDKSNDENIIEEFDTILENIRNIVSVDKLLKIKTKNYTL